jgi:hypothetical protein
MPERPFNANAPTFADHYGNRKSAFTPLAAMCTLSREIERSYHQISSA